MDKELRNFIVMIMIVGMIGGTCTILSIISLDNNRMLHDVTDILHTQTGNLTNQAHISHQLDEILGNTTASNGVLIPKIH